MVVNLSYPEIYKFSYLLKNINDNDVKLITNLRFHGSNIGWSNKIKVKHYYTFAALKLILEHHICCVRSNL